MRRYFSFAMLLSMMLGTMVSCSDAVVDIPGGEEGSKIKASELKVYSGGVQLATRATYDPKSEWGYSIPDSGRYHVYFFLRIDNDIPGEEDTHLTADQYYPRTSANKSLVSDANMGMVWANAEWRQCKNFSKYIWSKDGSAIQSIMAKEPTLEELIKADKGHNTDGSASDFSGLLAHKDELHFLWYTCKKQDSDHAWHIDGILTSKNRTNIDETKYGKEIDDNYNGKGMIPDTGSVKRNAHVEVDIHQQEHKDWNEIKTSIHMRDTVDIEVFLPIGYQELADDFDIRAGRDFVYVTEMLNAKITIGEKTYELETSIKHEETGIRIMIKPNKEALKAAREAYGDGITFEVHSYLPTAIPNETIWDMLKKSTCTTTPYTELKGQITSAFYEDSVKL